jgi:hypothetical protein
MKTGPLSYREKANALDERSRTASKFEVSWEMGDSLPYSVPTWFLLGS